MCRMLLFFICWSLAAGDEAMVDSTRMLIARCRAACMDNPTITSEGMQECIDRPLCLMCWETCELLMTNFVLWGPMCQVKSICFLGCRTSCNFHQNVTSESYTTPNKWVLPCDVEKEVDPETRQVEVTWCKPEPPIGQKNRGLVYIIAKQEKDSQPMEDKMQTIDQSTMLSSELLESKGQVQILAVTAEGLVSRHVITPSNHMTPQHKDEATSSTSTSGPSTSDISTSYPLTSNAITSDPKQSGQVTSGASRVGGSVFWMPELLSLQLSGKREAGMEATVSWHPFQMGSMYEVTWRVLDDAMDITGHLYTLRNITALSLWFNSLYAIQVSCMDEDSQILATSSPLLVDTRRLHLPDSQTERSAPKCNGPISLTSLSLMVVGGSAVLTLLLLMSFCFWRTCKDRRRGGLDLQNIQKHDCDGNASLLPVVEQKPSVPLNQEVRSAPHVTLAKTLSRKLSNLELQYSPLSPFRQKDHGQDLLTEESATDKLAFEFPRVSQRDSVIIERD